MTENCIWMYEYQNKMILRFMYVQFKILCELFLSNKTWLSKLYIQNINYTQETAAAQGIPVMYTSSFLPAY